MKFLSTFSNPAEIKSRILARIFTSILLTWNYDPGKASNSGALSKHTYSNTDIRGSSVLMPLKDDEVSFHTPRRRLATLFSVRRKTMIWRDFLCILFALIKCNEEKRNQI